jgi:acetyl-CoA carboxylase alpha subunit
MPIQTETLPLIERDDASLAGVNELLCEAARVYTTLSKDKRVNLGRALLNCSPELFQEACAAIKSREQHQTPVLNSIVTTGAICS